MSTRVRFIVILLSLAGSYLGLPGCTSVPVEPEVAIAPPPRIHTPHVESETVAEIQALFRGVGAPPLSVVRECGEEYRKRTETIVAKDELQRGIRAWVQREPEAAHWCFYGQYLLLEDELKSANFLDEKERAVVRSYAFLTPLAKALTAERGDPRYLRFAIARYRRLSEAVFYRRLDITPKAIQELENVAAKPEPAPTPVPTEKSAAAPGSTEEPSLSDANLNELDSGRAPASEFSPPKDALNTVPALENELDGLTSPNDSAL